MKKLKKILALLLTLALTFVMGTSVFADTKDTATITVNNADAASLTYAQIIKPDTTVPTGWSFVDDNVALAFITAFGVSDAQAAIDAIIVGSVDATKLSQAQANAEKVVPLITMANPQTVTSAGLYLIKATEEGYTYNLMTAYVGFGEVEINETTYEYPSLVDADVDAKKTLINVEKTVDDGDNVTKTGDILTYTVTTTVPYINPLDTDKTFGVHDELTGAVYADAPEFTVTLAGTGVTDIYTEDQPIAGGTTFNLKLDDMINDANSNAGKEVVITYKVKVTSENDEITNKAQAGHKSGSSYDSTYGEKEIKTYEGNITLTKTNEDETTKLAGAEFEVRKGSEPTPLKFTEITDENNNIISYKYDPDGSVTNIVTGTDGTVKVQGLDVGDYYFKEVKAPEGYSINGTDATATLEVADIDDKASAVITQTTIMKDTKLSALPSTGGMGTYIFTVVGVALMAIASALFLRKCRQA